MGLNKSDLIFAALQAALNKIDWKYRVRENSRMIVSGMRGDDLPIDVKIDVREDMETILYVSVLPFEVPAEKRMEMCTALNVTNYVLRDGCFSMDMADGNVLFKLTTCYHDCNVGMDLYVHYLERMCATVDHFDCKLYELSTGKISLKDYIAFVME